MLYHYSDKISIYFEDDEIWMIEEIKKISEKLIQDGCNEKNKEDLFTLLKRYVNKKDFSILYKKMLHKMIAYLSRDQYKIISIDPFRLEKFDK